MLKHSPVDKDVFKDRVAGLWLKGVLIMPMESLATDDHRRICKQFGCGKEVKHLHSEYCMDHPYPKIDPTKIIKL